MSNNLLCVPGILQSNLGHSSPTVTEKLKSRIKMLAEQAKAREERREMMKQKRYEARKNGRMKGLGKPANTSVADEAAAIMTEMLSRIPDEDDLTAALTEGQQDEEPSGEDLSDSDGNDY